MVNIVLFVGILSFLIYILSKIIKNSTWRQIWVTIRKLTPIVLAMLVAILMTYLMVQIF